MERGDDGEVVLLGDLAQQVDHVERGDGIERGHRFIGQQNRRVLHERPGDGHALLLTAGECIRTLISTIGQADPVELLDGFAAHRLRVHHQRDARSLE